MLAVNSMRRALWTLATLRPQVHAAHHGRLLSSTSTAIDTASRACTARNSLVISRTPTARFVWLTTSHQPTCCRALKTSVNASFFRFSSSSMSSITPLQAPPTWSHTPEELLELTKQALDRVKRIYDEVSALDAKDCNFESVSTYNSGLIISAL